MSRSRPAVGRRTVVALALVLVPVGAGMLLLTLAVPARAAPGGGGVLSLTGRVGSVQLGTSTEADITGAVGLPEATAQDNFQFPNAPEYKALGYGCGPVRLPGKTGLTYSGGAPYCRTVYYVNLTTGLFGSFFTASGAFHTSRGTRVGTTQQSASKREGRPATVGCLTGIGLTSQTTSIQIGMSGGKLRQGRPNRQGATRTYLVGGRVSGFAIDGRPDGVGILFC